ncbi:dihydrofolate reductase family protein [Cohnella kolymensis]|uniref:dihydrofolate reductase family protein n=1 Tax=Cohnella kolymensis TaxID=1590652 RepID=UPI000696E5FB|nr:dihydrofolate reductase family protein [Cohnella kolymensis]
MTRNVIYRYHLTTALERTFAARINEIEKVVLTNKELELDWRNSRQIIVRDSDSLSREVKARKQRDGKKISVESGVRTWQSFIRHELFDELRLLIHPVIAARGDKLFHDAGTACRLELLDCKRFGNGVVALHYERYRRSEMSV